MSAVLVSGDFVRTGGMDMPNFALAQYLANCGKSVQLVAYRVADALASHSNVRWCRVPKPMRSYLLGAPLLDLAGRKLGERCLSRGGRVVVNGGNCQVGDVNWVHYVHAAYTPVVKGSLAMRAKSALTRKLNLAQERSALRLARVVIANSERTRRDLVERVGVDNERIRTVYYGIDADRFLPASDERRRTLRREFGWPDRPQVAFVGALGDRRKGFDTLFAAWSNLCRSSSWDSDLVVIGHGAELESWRARAQTSGIGERVRFLGFRKDVPDVLAACDALVAPTRYEAFGLGVQEALCTGLPAMVSAAAGVAERYPAALKELLLEDPDSASELEISLRNWRDRGDHLRKMTMQLSDTLRQRTWQVMAEEVGALLD
jgi:glycosyltransferase involved in cell wall biosynthesis